MATKKPNLSKLKQAKKIAPRIKEIVKEEKPKVGRPSDKIEGVEYDKFTCSLPVDTIDKMKAHILGTPRSDRPTQNKFIDKAILFYIEQHPIN